MIIINYPSNPCGTTHQSGKLKELAAVARENNMIILSDEIYGLLHHEGIHESISRYYPEGTIVSSGLSKWCGAGGWRLGTFAFPNELRGLLDAMNIVASESFTSVSAPIQFAAIQAFKESKELDNYLYHSRRILKFMCNWIVRELKSADLTVKKPSGGFYLLPDFQNYREHLEKMGISTSNKLAESILNVTGVAALPGSDFGLDPKELLLRMSYVDFDGAAALEVSKASENDLDEQFLMDCCPNVVRGIQALISWLGKISG